MEAWYPFRTTPINGRRFTAIVPNRYSKRNAPRASRLSARKQSKTTRPRATAANPMRTSTTVAVTNESPDTTARNTTLPSGEAARHTSFPRRPASPRRMRARTSCRLPAGCHQVPLSNIKVQGKRPHAESPCTRIPMRPVFSNSPLPAWLGLPVTACRTGSHPACRNTSLR